MKLIVGALCALLFVGSNFHLRTMDVTYVHQKTQSVSLVDCDGDGFSIKADGVNVDDRLICLCYGEGVKTVILDYVKEAKDE